MEVVGTNITCRNMSFCEEHGFQLDSFCQVHRLVCCQNCVSKLHSDCGEIVPLKTAASSEESFEDMDSMMKSLEELMGKFDSARGSERESMRSVDIQGRELERKVKKFRQNVNEMLDKLEVTMLMKKDEICGDERLILKKRIEVCEMAIRNIKDSLQKMKTIQKGKNEERTLIAASKMRNMNDKYSDILDELVDGKGKFALNFIPNGDLVHALDSLGSINVKSTIKPTQIDNGEDREARLVKTKEIDVTSPSDTMPCTITGCAYLPDNTVVLADESNKSLKVVKPDTDTKVTQVQALDYAPWDVTAISDNQVALRSSFSQDKVDKKVHILKVTDDAIVETSTITVDGRPRAIAYHDGLLYVAVTKQDSGHISVISMSGKVKKTIHPKRNIIHDPQYIDFIPDKAVFYISDYTKGLAALAMNGGIIFQRVEGSTSEYGGVTVDNHGDVFVCAGKPYGIYRVTPDGSGLVPFITWEDEAIDPQALTFCKRNKTFLVTCCNSEKAYVYGYIPTANGNK